MRPYTAPTRGGIQLMSDGVPDLRPINLGRTNAAGGGWFGIERRGAYRVTSVNSEELLLP